MNVITVTGNATKDMELRYSASGTAFASGSIAVRRDFKNQAGEYETDFFNYTAIGKIGEVMANHISKGDKFGITGRLQNRTWEKQDGSKQTATEIIVNGFDFPSKPQNGSNFGQNDKGNSNTAGNQNNAGNGQFDVSQLEDLPF